MEDDGLAQRRRAKRAFYPAHPHVTDIWLALEHAFHFEIAAHSVIEGQVSHSGPASGDANKGLGCS